MYFNNYYYKIDNIIKYNVKFNYKNNKIDKMIGYNSVFQVEEKELKFIYISILTKFLINWVNEKNRLPEKDEMIKCSNSDVPIGKLWRYLKYISKNHPYYKFRERCERESVILGTSLFLCEDDTEEEDRQYGNLKEMIDNLIEEMERQRLIFLNYVVNINRNNESDVK